jgi:hypothetical protein
MGTALDGRDASSVGEMGRDSPHFRPSKALFSQKNPIAHLKSFPPLDFCPICLHLTACSAVL